METGSRLGAINCYTRYNSSYINPYTAALLAAICINEYALWYNVMYSVRFSYKELVSSSYKESIWFCVRSGEAYGLTEPYAVYRVYALCHCRKVLRECSTRHVQSPTQAIAMYFPSGPWEDSQDFIQTLLLSEVYIYNIKINIEYIIIQVMCLSISLFRWCC